ncbi:kraken [Carabus blaptoides fortunei]
MATPYTNGISSRNDTTISCEEITIPVPWGHISGKWWGTKSVQPVIAIHGWQDNAGTFDNLAPLLARDIPILSIDLPGHGLSSHYPTGQYYYIFWDGIVVLRRIVKHFKWDKISIMGHSLGGAIAFMYAAAYPNAVDRYVSIDIASPAVRDPKEMVASIGQNLDRFLKFETLAEENMPCYEYNEMIDLVHDAYHGSTTRQACEVLMKRGMRPASTGKGYSFTRDMRLKVSSLAYATLEQVLQLASRITCNVMNIRANPGMKWTIPEHYDLVLDEITKSASRMERHVVPGMHHLHLNNAESVAPIIRKFLLE